MSFLISSFLGLFFRRVLFIAFVLYLYWKRDPFILQVILNWYCYSFFRYYFFTSIFSFFLPVHYRFVYSFEWPNYNKMKVSFTNVHKINFMYCRSLYTKSFEREWHHLFHKISSDPYSVFLMTYIIWSNLRLSLIIKRSLVTKT